MFYSHEILGNTQYGVATIWLVATVGKGDQKKLTKKAIQNVNVPKACEKILDPGAPLALRLQGNLLYGVSRVFAQQCNYVLTDAEKIQSEIMTYFRFMDVNAIDPKAGIAKRQNIILEDDPSFDLMSALPNIDQLTTWDKDPVVTPSQGSAGKFSQMTPLGGSQQSSSLGHNFAQINLQIPSSSHSAASCRLPSDFGHNSPLYSKATGEADKMPDFQPFLDDEDPFAGMGLGFDAHGNFMGLADQEEPQLPPLTKEQFMFEANQSRPAHQVTEQGYHELNEDARVFNLDEAAPPEAPTRSETAKTLKMSMRPTSSFIEIMESVQATARLNRARNKRTPNSMLDSEVMLPSHQWREWSNAYTEIMDSGRNPQKKTTSRAQAKKNAFGLLYGTGIAGIGNNHGLKGYVHPLAMDFAGDAFKDRIEGREPDDGSAERLNNGRRRTSEEAFEEEKDKQSGRNVRPRNDDDAELGRGQQGEKELENPILGDDSLPEIGMEARPAMEDRHSSLMMPWSRAGSAIPGSSVRGSAQKSRTAPSPLLARGGTLASIDRYSDPAEPQFGSGVFGSQDSSLHLEGSNGLLNPKQENNTQILKEEDVLDLASQDFLGYATKQAEDYGVKYPRDGENQRWVEFETLADPAKHTKSIAAQAFIHVLSLASKKAITVHQDGAEKMRPFGPIRLGIAIPTDGNDEELEQVESEDELS